MRVVGTPEARRAWLILRGPFFGAYLTLVAIAASVQPVTSLGWVWKFGIILCAGAAAIGCAASWAIIGRGKLGQVWQELEAFEVTGLRLIVILQFIYAPIIFFVLHPGLAYILLNFCIGLFALGILTNMVWNKPTGRNG
jgi:hypothetical protein